LVVFHEFEAGLFCFRPGGHSTHKLTINEFNHGIADFLSLSRPPKFHRQGLGNWVKVFMSDRRFTIYKMLFPIKKTFSAGKLAWCGHYCGSTLTRGKRFSNVPNKMKNFSAG
jgi:hypothetical protein